MLLPQVGAQCLFGDLQHFLVQKKKVTFAVGHLSYTGFRDLSKLVNADVHAN
jgi:hypothetical protein